MVEVQNPKENSFPECSINCFPQDGLKYAIFSGPDGLAPQRSHLLADNRPIGTNRYTKEATYETDYLWRAGPLPVSGTPIHLRPRSAYVGEIGWHSFVFRDTEPNRTGHQILTSEFRQETEDSYTHRFQSAWYPGEDEVGNPASGGSYFRRCPTPAARRSHSSMSYTDRSPLTSRCMTSRPYRPWRRTPAATQVTMYDIDHVSVEQSQEGSVGSSRKGNRGTHNSRLPTFDDSTIGETPPFEEEDNSSSNSYARFHSSQKRRHHNY